MSEIVIIRPPRLRLSPLNQSVVEVLCEHGWHTYAAHSSIDRAIARIAECVLCGDQCEGVNFATALAALKRERDGLEEHINHLRRAIEARAKNVPCPAQGNPE